MELVSDEKLEAVADFLSDDEVFGIAPCSHFNNSLKRNRVNVPCDIGDCDGDCPFYSKNNFIKWFKEENCQSLETVYRLTPKQGKISEEQEE